MTSQKLPNKLWYSQIWHPSSRLVHTYREASSQFNVKWRKANCWANAYSMVSFLTIENGLDRRSVSAFCEGPESIFGALWTIMSLSLSIRKQMSVNKTLFTKPGCSLLTPGPERKLQNYIRGCLCEKKKQTELGLGDKRGLGLCSEWEVFHIVFICHQINLYSAYDMANATLTL